MRNSGTREPLAVCGSERACVRVCVNELGKWWGIEGLTSSQCSYYCFDLIYIHPIYIYIYMSSLPISYFLQSLSNDPRHVMLLNSLQTGLRYVKPESRTTDSNINRRLVWPLPCKDGMKRFKATWAAICTCSTSPTDKNTAFAYEPQTKLITSW